MTDVMTVGSPIEGGISVDLDEVRATPPADQWKHTDLLCGLVVHLREELERTTGDLAVACEVARQRGEATVKAGECDYLRDYDPCYGGEEQTTRHLSVCVPWYEYRDRGRYMTTLAIRIGSATNPDGFVAEQIAETTALLRSLWLEHHVTVMKLGGPVTDPAASFDSWLAAVSGGGH